ncbi:MAG: transposase [Verrucomicrobia bacterium]|nr:transposase [Verrucomicrobiota bacterium]
MARPLRIDVEGGWYHVMSRGIERRTIFLDDSFCLHFLDLLGEMTDRFGVEVHAYVLMDNHYHLILHTPGANASQAMQWLNVSFSAWSNAKRQRVGHVFQGRFRSTLIDGDGAWLLAASAYVHLNPVRVLALGLGKAANKAESLGLVKPDVEQVRERLRVLREHRWSSYRAYGNYTAAPEWLVTRELLDRAGGRERYRRHVQSYVTRGMDPAEFTGFPERVALGSREFLERARSCVQSVSSEQPDRSFLTRRVPFEKIVSVVEAVKGEAFADFRNRHGDWGLAMVLFLSRRRSGLTLPQIGEAVGGMAYKTVFAQVKRFQARLKEDPFLREAYEQCQNEMSIVET